MRALLVLPLLLCAVVHVDQVKAEVKAVKLCGREFLRAVVYTCGGSRWRRFFSETDMGGDGETSFYSRKEHKKQEPKDLTFTLDVRIQERMMQESI